MPVRIVHEGQLTDATPTADLGLRPTGGELLAPADRCLYELCLVRGETQRAAARLLGLPDSTVSRHMARLFRVLNDPTFKALADRADQLPPDLRAVAIERYARRASIRGLMRRTGRSYDSIRRDLDYVEGWAKGYAARPRPST